MESRKYNRSNVLILFFFLLIFQAILISIRSQLLQGGARLDPHKRYDYTEQEAKEAFDRMVREHGW